jgi:hypothetical protein
MGNLHRPSPAFRFPTTVAWTQYIQDTGLITKKPTAMFAFLVIPATATLNSVSNHPDSTSPGSGLFLISDREI